MGDLTTCPCGTDLSYAGDTSRIKHAVECAVLRELHDNDACSSTTCAHCLRTDRMRGAH